MPVDQWFVIFTFGPCDYLDIKGATYCVVRTLYLKLSHRDANYDIVKNYMDCQPFG